MYQLDWSFADPSGSRIFQIDEVNQQVRFSKQVRSINPIYTKEIIDHDRIQLSANKQVRNFIWNCFIQSIQISSYVYRLMSMVIVIQSSSMKIESSCKPIDFIGKIKH